jgi:hypothetical protein
MPSNWKSLRAGEEKAESLLNTDEDNGSNNGEASTDSTGTAHRFLQAKEVAAIRSSKLKPLKERLMETEEQAARYRETLQRSQRNFNNG